MNSLNRLTGLVLAAAGLSSGTILWDGRFNDLSSSTDLTTWTWSNQVGPYQYYIHGSGPVTDYVNFDASYKNPADTGSSKGAKISLTSTSYWDGQTMRRTELIPQTSAPINKGKVYYHFSMMRADTNAPSIYREHQIAFFESHFTEMKAGWISGEQVVSDPLLRWDVSSQTQWSTNWTAGVWHNVAYEIDFSGGSVGFWHSTGSDPLKQVVAPMSVGASSNGADWHVGVLELPRSGYADTDEDIYFSGVYIESGSLTTSISGPGGSTNPVSSSSVAGTTTTTPRSSTLVTSTKMMSSSTAVPPPVTTTAAQPTTSAPSSGGPAASHWAQCGGSGYSGPTSCAAPYACSTMNPWYAQCL